MPTHTTRARPSGSCALSEKQGPFISLFDKRDIPVDWEYDGEADTLYISFGRPRSATGLDVGEGVVLRYDEQAREVVGLTIIGVGRRLEEYVRARGVG